MMPEHAARRAIIREWMLLAKEKRQTAEQAAAFAMKVTERVLSPLSSRTDNAMAVAPRR
jgi:hypothetical protein